MACNGSLSNNERPKESSSRSSEQVNGNDSFKPVKRGLELNRVDEAILEQLLRRTLFHLPSCKRGWLSQSPLCKSTLRFITSSLIHPQRCQGRSWWKEWARINFLTGPFFSRLLLDSFHLPFQLYNQLRWCTSSKCYCLSWPKTKYWKKP